MGNSNSIVHSNDPVELLDYLASQYIFNMDFVSLKRLNDPKYCDKLTILTSDVLSRYLTELELEGIDHRIKHGAPIVFFNEADLGKITSNLSPEHKDKLCKAISQFYVKISQIFSAIVTTVNPTSVYRNPPNSRKVRNNICDNRIRALNRRTKHALKPNLCSKMLVQQQGIPELRELYNDADYNPNTGKFEGMSPKTKEIFLKDLEDFYTVFTGKDASQMANDNIRDFSDIKFHSYCQTNNKAQTTDDPDLIKEYAENLKHMIRQKNERQQKLLSMLDKLFVYVVDEHGQKRVRVHPKLTESSLAKLTEEVRSMILKTYLSCETDFTKGVYLYESIVLQKTLESAKNQIAHLEQEKIKIKEKISEYNISP